MTPEPGGNGRWRRKSRVSPKEKMYLNRTLFPPPALKPFKVCHHIPEQQVHILPTMEHRFSELSLLSHSRLPFFISGNTWQGNVHKLPKASWGLSWTDNSLLPSDPAIWPPAILMPLRVTQSLPVPRWPSSKMKTSINWPGSVKWIRFFSSWN